MLISPANKIFLNSQEGSILQRKKLNISLHLFSLTLVLFWKNCHTCKSPSNECKICDRAWPPLITLWYRWSIEYWLHPSTRLFRFLFLWYSVQAQLRILICSLRCRYWLLSVWKCIFGELFELYQMINWMQIRFVVEIFGKHVEAHLKISVVSILKLLILLLDSENVRRLFRNQIFTKVICKSYFYCIFSYF